jgi:hypothetical protein
MRLKSLTKKSGKMSTTLFLENGNITIQSGAAQNPSATVG